MNPQRSSRTRRVTLVLAAGALGLAALSGCGSDGDDVPPTTTSAGQAAIAANDLQLTLDEWNADTEDKSAVNTGYYAAQELMPALCDAFRKSPSQADAMTGIVELSAEYDISEDQALGLVALAAEHACRDLWESLPAR